ncbi:Ig-like domain-containing protein [Heyndrickxia oleronia]|uniref:Ig-like domain-containing protein n=1 Tax=Heyndrickxia oleronia TaxID=38875 RepID=UPI001B03F770|nr:Ig-like domain-containing protein [Heyndrickxia oleronia]GIN38459.1 hypothetical protein J19TS1_14080 [Heyndrickxia oleronia]
METYNLYRDGKKVASSLTEKSFTDTGLTANKEYSYQISAENEVGESVLSEPLLVRTKYSAVSNVSLNKTTLALETGTNSTLTVTVSPSTADPSVTWTSSDPSIATVDTNGKVVAVKAGSATITVTSKADNTKKATCTVTVTDPTPPPEGE